MVHIGVHPDAELQKLFDLCKGALVDMNDDDMEKLVSEQPALNQVTIPAESYPSQAKKVSTLGTRVVLIASGNLDGETVRGILDVISGNLKYLQHAHPALSSFRMKAPESNAAIGIRMHPGAAGYFSGK